MKEFSNALGLLNEKYIIKEKLGEGACSTVYKVQDMSTNKEYAAKVVEHYCKNEYQINKKLSELQNPYIIQLIEFSQGTIKIGNSQDYKAYYIFELANKGELTNYLGGNNKGFSEIHTKFIIYDILKGFQEIHNAEICHRDIKTENILLSSDDYKIKICDFGFSSNTSELLEGKYGTQYYMAPEIIMGKEYDGIKADIFSLGVLLFNIRTNKFIFDKAKVTNNKNNPTKYDYIKQRNEKIWKLNNIYDLSQDFKELYLSMVAFNPKERPTIQQILDGPWMQGIINLSESDFIKIKKEVINEFKQREKKCNFKE